MSETKFTPGPWVATTTKAGKGKVIDSQGFSVCNTSSGSYKQQLIDAHLIAAAPDLYEALEEVVRISDREHQAWHKAKAALAKARGEQ